MKLFRRIVGTLVIVAIVFYLAGLGVLYFFQRNFQYEPTGSFLALTDTALTNASVVTIPTDGGESVTGWYAPPAVGKPVIVYYKGNADSFSSEHARFEQFAAEGYGFLAFDYRGFPASPGVLDEDNVLADALAAFDWVKQKGFPLVIWGRSLGSGPATYVASLQDADALFLETPFDSAVSVARDRYGFFPVDWLMQDQYRVDLWIADVTEPVFVAHGTADRTIAEYHGQRVYDLAPNKAGIWIVPDAGHSDLWRLGEWEKARAFFEASEKAAGR